VRVWWRYLRVRFTRHSKMAGKVSNMEKEEKAIPLLSALCFI
jgi:hypothetical protein